MFLGIDIGTSGIKATIVGGNGDILSHAYRSLTTYGIEKKRRELDPREVKEKMFSAMEEALETCGKEEVRLILIDSLGEAVVPVAKDGTVLMNSIIGSDPRGGEELEWLKEKVGEPELVSITGLNLSYIYSLNKILWIRRNAPDVHGRVWKYLCYTDYAGYLLTGETKIDHAMASRTMAFDIKKSKWSGRILDAAGISQDMFSDPVPGGTLIGTLREELRVRFGLKRKVPVMVGSHDHIYNAIGVGAAKAGICSNTIGTTEGITTVLGERMQTETIIKNNISCEPFVQRGLYNTVAWHNTAGAMVNWYLDTFFRESGQSRDAILAKLNKTIPDRPSGLMVLPHFSGATAKYMDEKAKGGILGLTMATTREEIYQAILEGSSYECRVITECIRDAGIPVEKIIVSGGGSKSRFWVQAKANILGRPVCKACGAESGARGGAAVGAVTLGIFSDLEEAVGEMIPPSKEIEPQSEYRSIYEERYQEYKELYLKLRRLNHQLS